ncbi:MAG TPA: hypothetical protein VGD99_24460 [Anaerolineae bacterium]|jgi:hypothetical protein
MLNPTALLDLAYVIQAEKLQQAEARQLVKQIEGSQPGLLRRIGGRLQATGRRLMAQTRSHRARPAFGEK